MRCVPASRVLRRRIVCCVSVYLLIAEYWTSVKLIHTHKHTRRALAAIAPHPLRISFATSLHAINTGRCLCPPRRPGRVTTGRSSPSATAASRTWVMPAMVSIGFESCAKRMRLEGEQSANIVADTELYDLVVGPFGYKYVRCVRAYYSCIEVEPALFGPLNNAVRARVAHARLVAAEGEAALVLAARVAAEEAVTDLNRKLKAYQANRARVVGDKVTPRKRGGGAATASRAVAAVATEAVVLELQGVRRGLLALVECQLIVSLPRPALASHANRTRRSFAVPGFRPTPSTTSSARTRVAPTTARCPTAAAATGRGAMAASARAVAGRAACAAQAGRRRATER